MGDDGRLWTLLAAAGLAGAAFVRDGSRGVATDLPFLPLSTIERFVPRMVSEGVSEVARSHRGFLTAYREARGQPERLDDFWWRRRAGFLARHLAQVEKNGEELFDPRGRPTCRHLALIAWAFSPTPSELLDPEGSRGVVRRGRQEDVPRPRFAIGDRVRVETGTSRGWPGTIEDVASSERIDPSVPRGTPPTPFAYYVSEHGHGGHWVYEGALRSLRQGTS
jgi:hypothetical protein